MVDDGWIEEVRGYERMRSMGQGEKGLRLGSYRGVSWHGVRMGGSCVDFFAYVGWILGGILGGG
jgi:hypothetical protein